MEGAFHQLGPGAKIAIVGGGPAGSFFALYLLRFAEEKGIHLDVTIYQEKDFNNFGPRGCKGCAGIISASALRNMSELGLKIPPEIVQARIEHYSVHSPYTEISISNPEKDSEIISVYRGGGPRVSHCDNPVSLDGWLLMQTLARGTGVERHPVTLINLEGKPRVYTGDNGLEYDLVVLATGVNSSPVKIEGLDYIPPRTSVMAQDELYAGADEVRATLGNVAHAFLVPDSRIIFGTLVPKGPFINVSVLNNGEQPASVDDFLRNDMVRRILPEKYKRSCGCRPRVAVSAARNYYANRFVAIGDSAVTRLYKDGTGSALSTARQAAWIAIHYGVGQKDFRRHYEPFCHTIDRDNRWGQLLFRMNDRIKNSPVFLLTQHRLLGDEQHDAAGRQPFTRAAWGMFTGSYSYRNIARMALSPSSIVRLGLACATESVKALLHKGAPGPRSLHVGSKKVLILGSGFGGTSALRRLVPSLNRNENVETTMVSDENFFLFSPLLHEVAMGGIETRHVAYPIRRLHWRDRFNFIQATVNEIDLANRKVMTTRGTFNFDYLILALGNVSNISEIKAAGPVENVFTLKTLRDSRLIRNRIIGLFEEASAEKDPERQKQLLTFIVSGGGYRGIQVVSELSDFIYKSLIRFYKTVDEKNIRVMLIETESEIGSELDPKLASYAFKRLQNMKIEIRLSSRITQVWDSHVEINQREVIPAGTLIWVAGLATNPRIAELNVARDELGRVIVNEYMEVPEFPGVYAVGDCAYFEDPGSGQPIPPRAHTTVRQAKVAANNILADIRGRDKRAYHYSNAVEMVSLGAYRAMFRFRSLRIYGFPARLMWVGAYSLLVTGTYNRVRIIMDWLLSLLFGRDTTFIKDVLNRRDR